MPTPDSSRRVQESIVAIQRLANSRKLDVRRAERSGVPLSLVAAGVLRQVVELGPVRPATLGDRARMQPAALSRQLAILERGGCVDRVPDPDDGRGRLIRPTDYGRTVYRKVRRANEELFADQLAGWQPAELDQLADLLERLITDLRSPVTARN